MDISNENKRILLIILFALIIVGVILFLMFYNRPLDRQIIGTWISNDGRMSWTFHSDGTFEGSDNEVSFIAHYELNGAQLIFIDPENPELPPVFGYIEINGRTMILMYGNVYQEFRKR
jgi:hypothetical protein